MVCSGADLTVDPVNFHDFQKHLGKNNSTVMKLTKEAIDENTDEGGSLAKK